MKGCVLCVTTSPAKTTVHETEVVLARIVWVCKLVVASECREFWETYDQDEEDGRHFYLAEIRKFVTSSISCESPTRFTSILPVLTKLMGSLQCNYYK